MTVIYLNGGGCEDGLMKSSKKSKVIDKTTKQNNKQKIKINHINNKYTKKHKLKQKTNNRVYK